MSKRTRKEKRPQTHCVVELLNCDATKSHLHTLPNLCKENQTFLYCQQEEVIFLSVFEEPKIELSDKQAHFKRLRIEKNGKR